MVDETDDHARRNRQHRQRSGQQREYLAAVDLAPGVCAEARAPMRRVAVGVLSQGGHQRRLT
jgi:hypothetical protein